MNASDPTRKSGRAAAAALLMLLPAACISVPKPPSNPFAGSWSTGEKQQIAFRNDTVVVSPADQAPTPLGAAACDGKFNFGYSRESRGALIGLPLHQPDLQRQLSDLLTRPDYSVAELTCGEGGTVYVLLDDRDVLAIHSDRDIAGIERLTRL